MSLTGSDPKKGHPGPYSLISLVQEPRPPDEILGCCILPYWFMHIRRYGGVDV
jgi:hypothetical protein